MYNCDRCGNPTRARQKILKVVTATRGKTYPQRMYTKGKEIDPDDPKGARGRHKIYDPGGVGHETVKEQKLCLPCHSRHMMEESNLFAETDPVVIQLVNTMLTGI